MNHEGLCVGSRGAVYAAHVLTTLPLFPLNTVLVPGLVMPLHIFEPRYCELIENLLSNPDINTREFGIIAVRDGRSLEENGVEALYDVGTAAVLRNVDRVEDGLFDIVTLGSRRFLIQDVDISAPLATATVEFLDEPTGDVSPRQLQQVAQRFTTYRTVLGGRFDDGDASTDDLPEEATVLSYLITASMVLPTNERQALLSAVDAQERLTLASTLLARENAIIAVLSAVPAIDLLPPISSPN